MGAVRSASPGLVAAGRPAGAGPVGTDRSAAPRLRAAGRPAGAGVARAAGGFTGELACRVGSPNDPSTGV